MLFQTTRFAVFFVCVLLLSAVFAKRRTYRHMLLLAASYIFYMAWNSLYLGLILFSTVVDFWVGSALYTAKTERTRKVLLTLSLVGNLGVLGVFKYYGFFVENIEELFAVIGFSVSAPTLRIILPVGISFYTFQSLSYTLDIYKGRIAPSKSLLEFSLFVAFFPQLVAGPIVRARDFLPQLSTTPRVSDELASSGIYLFLKGLIKKVVFADLIGALLVDPVFASPGDYGGAWMLLAILGFKLQIYCDFSGYSDMAIGCGRLLGYRLPVNFRSPYKAASIGEYWSRWHITLGSWFRDYVFFPLGGSRSSAPRVYINILLTFLLVGLWHGASWTFVIWGGYYGVLSCIERALSIRRGSDSQGQTKWPRRLGKVGVTLLLTTIASAIFRVRDLGHLRDVFAAFTVPTDWSAEIETIAFLAFLGAAVTHFLPEDCKERAEAMFVNASAFTQATAVVAALVLIRITMSTASPFYYFQF